MIGLRLYPLGGEGSGGGGGTLSVSLLPDDINEYDPSAPGTAADSCVATAANGLAPYTYLWEFVTGSGFAAGVVITGTTTDTCNFSLTAATETVRSFVYRCTVTDSAMATASADVSVYLQVGGLPP